MENKKKRRPGAGLAAALAGAGLAAAGAGFDTVLGIVDAATGLIASLGLTSGLRSLGSAIGCYPPYQICQKLGNDAHGKRFSCE
jgi:hypothetical protein